jgi:hypothetical protein
MIGVCRECGGMYSQHSNGCPNTPSPAYCFDCPECGHALYEDNLWYPQLEVCEYCVNDFKKEVEKKQPIDDWEPDD